MVYIISWNVAGWVTSLQLIREHYGTLSNYLNRHQVDIFAIQEAKVTKAKLYDDPYACGAIDKGGSNSSKKSPKGGNGGSGIVNTSASPRRGTDGTGRVVDIVGGNGGTTSGSNNEDVGYGTAAGGMSFESLTDEWDSFWSCCSEEGKKGYSGVTTYARKGLTVRADSRPLGVEELDKEGRCLLTEHGTFVIFNVYVPNSGGTEVRRQFKHKFLFFLRERMKQVRQSGKHVVLLGDLNIARRVVDVALNRRMVNYVSLRKGLEERQEHSPVFSRFPLLRRALLLYRKEILSVLDENPRELLFPDMKAALEKKDVSLSHNELLQLSEAFGLPYYIPESVRWVESVMQEDGMVDAFADIYPEARERFTCWDQHKNGRYRNQGTRIDVTMVDRALFDRAVVRSPPSALGGGVSFLSNVPEDPPESARAALRMATADGKWMPAPLDKSGILDAPQAVYDTQFTQPYTGIIYTPPRFSDHVAVSLLMRDDDVWTRKGWKGRASERDGEMCDAVSAGSANFGGVVAGVEAEGEEERARRRGGVGGGGEGGGGGGGGAGERRVVVRGGGGAGEGGTGGQGGQGGAGESETGDQFHENGDDERVKGVSGSARQPAVEQDRAKLRRRERRAEEGVSDGDFEGSTREDAASCAPCAKLFPMKRFMLQLDDRTRECMFTHKQKSIKSFFSSAGRKRKFQEVSHSSQSRKVLTGHREISSTTGSDVKYQKNDREEVRLSGGRSQILCTEGKSRFKSECQGAQQSPSKHIVCDGAGGESSSLHLPVTDLCPSVSASSEDQEMTRKVHSNPLFATAGAKSGTKLEGESAEYTEQGPHGETKTEENVYTNADPARNNVVDLIAENSESELTLATARDAPRGRELNGECEIYEQRENILSKAVPAPGIENSSNGGTLGGSHSARATLQIRHLVQTRDLKAEPRIRTFFESGEKKLHSESKSKPNSARQNPARRGGTERVNESPRTVDVDKTEPTVETDEQISTRKSVKDDKGHNKFNDGTFKLYDLARAAGVRHKHKLAADLGQNDGRTTRSGNGDDNTAKLVQADSMVLKAGSGVKISGSTSTSSGEAGAKSAEPKRLETMSVPSLMVRGGVVVAKVRAKGVKTKVKVTNAKASKTNKVKPGQRSIHGFLAKAESKKIS